MEGKWVSLHCRAQWKITLTMKFFFMLLLLFIYSCGYPDIDSVPTFNKVDLTDEELMDLCDSKSSDNNNNQLCNN